MVETVQQLPANPKAELPDLAQRIKAYHAGIINAAKDVVVKAISAGLVLKEARKQIDHGDWLDWLKDHCDLSERTAYRYMQLATNRVKIEEALKGKSATMATLSLNKALRLIEAKDDKSGIGPDSKYAKAQETLLRSLKDLLPEDIEDAAQRTISELNTAIAAVKKSISNAA